MFNYRIVDTEKLRILDAIPYGSATRIALNFWNETIIRLKLSRLLKPRFINERILLKFLADNSY
jgi:hypothetical protein